MQAFKVGHHTNTEFSTGISVFLFNQPAIAAYHICGSSPATRELPVLDVESNVATLDGLVLTGGSAFGLGAVDGVMHFLREKNRGKKMPHGGVVPIVPAAAIYDLAVNQPIPPTAEEAYLACLAADEHNISQGRVGAGTGASIGKIVPHTHRMSGGLGYATMRLANGLSISAYAVVNAVGDIRDSQNEIIVGAKLKNGQFADCQTYLLSGQPESYFSQTNTVLVAVFTNAAFSKIELKRIAKMATAGVARAVSPAFTRYDGDIIFAVSLGEHVASEVMVGAIAAEMTQHAIINAVKESVVL